MTAITEQAQLADREDTRSKEHESYWSRVLSRFMRNRMGVVALIVLLVIVLASLFAEQVAAYDPVAINFSARYLPPAWEAEGTIDHLFGTDSNGRDLLSRIIYGGRVSLLVGFVASTISSVIGIVLGLVAGYAGGLVDRFIMRLSDIWLAFPFLVLAIAVIAVIGSDVPVLIGLLSFAGWVYPARVTRALTRQIMRTDYVEAATALGARPIRIIVTHIFPNVITANIVLWTFAVGTLILIESALSFLGLGVRPPTPSWGNILSDGRNFIVTGEWWLSIMPGLAITITVLCVNTIGDALQEAMDLRIQQ